MARAQLLLLVLVVAVLGVGYKSWSFLAYRDEPVALTGFEAQREYLSQRDRPRATSLRGGSSTVVGILRVSRFSGEATGYCCLWYRYGGYKAMETVDFGDHTITGFWSTDGSCVGALRRSQSLGVVSSELAVNSPSWPGREHEPSAPWVLGDRCGGSPILWTLGNGARHGNFRGYHARNADECEGFEWPQSVHLGGGRSE